MRETVWHEQSTRTGKYSVRWYDPTTGKKQRLRCDTFQECKAKKIELKSKLQNHRSGGGEPNALVWEVFERYIAWCERSNYRSETIRLKRVAMKEFTKIFSQIYKITEDELARWKSSMELRYSPTTVSIRLREARAFLNWCVEEGRVLTATPFKIVIKEVKVARRRVSEQEIEALEKTIPARFRPYFLLIVDHGTRVRETLQMRWDMVDLDQKTWLIPGSISKNHEDRVIPLSDRCVEALRGLSRTSELVFDGWGKVTPNHYLKRAAKRAGLTGPIHPHLFRHTRASNWKGNVYALKDYMGWKSWSMGKRYSHHNIDDLREQAQKT